MSKITKTKILMKTTKKANLKYKKFAYSNSGHYNWTLLQTL